LNSGLLNNTNEIFDILFINTNSSKLALYEFVPSRLVQSLQEIFNCMFFLNKGCHIGQHRLKGFDKANMAYRQ
jgi:hypothetical protein